jgi:fucose permease
MKPSTYWAFFCVVSATLLIIGAFTSMTVSVLLLTICLSMGLISFVGFSFDLIENWGKENDY